MKRSRFLSAALVLTMLCALLSGCVYVDSDAAVHDDGSGTVTFSSGILADEGEEPEEGQKVFEANGNKYYGTTENYTFASVDEFNALFTPEGEDSIPDNSNLAGTLRKNSDGSLTLALIVVGSDDEEDAAEETTEAGTTAADTDDDSVELSEEDIAQLDAAGDAMMEAAYVKYTFRFDQPIRQTSGPKDAVSIDGSVLTVDLIKQADDETNPVYVFVTDVRSEVVPTRQTLKIDGAEKTAEIYNINGANYFKLRDMAALLTGTAAQFSVDYDAVSNTIVIETGKAYAAIEGDLTTPAAAEAAGKAGTAVKSAQSLTIDGKAAFLAPYNIGGNNYFALRDLGAAVGFGVDYDGAARAMLVSTK